MDNKRHVQQTLEEVRFRIAQLQDLMQGLELLREWTASGGALPPPPREERPVQTSGAGRPRPEKSVRTGLVRAVRAAMDLMAGPFDARDLASELPAGSDYESVKASLRYLCKKGELEVAAAGGPQRAAKYRIKPQPKSL